jgi:hypothetical protein
MSRAFVKETDDQSVDLRDRPISPHPNLVTPEGLAAIEREIGRFSAAHRAAVENMTKPPLRPRNASFAIGQRAEPPQNGWSRQQTAPTSILGCESLCDVRMGALKRFA